MPRSRGLRLYIYIGIQFYQETEVNHLLHLYDNGLPFNALCRKKSKTPLFIAQTSYMFRLIPVRSPLLRESYVYHQYSDKSEIRWYTVLIIFFSSGYWDVSLPQVVSTTPMYSAQGLRRLMVRGVPPFGHLRIKGCLSPPRSLSQTATSFIVWQCQGIHRVLLYTTEALNRASLWYLLFISINCNELPALIFFSLISFTRLIQMIFWMSRVHKMYCISTVADLDLPWACRKVFFRFRTFVTFRISYINKTALPSGQNNSVIFVSTAWMFWVCGELKHDFLK